MKKIFLSLIALSSVFCVAKAEDKVLMTIDGEPVMQSEFLYIYNKNNQETTVDQKTMDEYLDLFINFKLKVREAQAQGIDTTKAFIDELAGYRKQAIPKYMQDTLLEEQMMKLTYEHMMHDRRVSHIAIECHPDATPEEVEAALQKINEARERVTVGKEVLVGKGKKAKMVRQGKEDFHAVALEMSTDPSVQENQGELGWIVPLRYVWPFEKAVYETAIGEVSNVFRTNYGFHIAWVMEERDHHEVHASHIMKMVPRGNDSISKAKLIEIMGIYQEVMNGADFAATAIAKSDDKGSAVKGGDLGWFGHGVMVKQFEDQAFSLKPGEISQPFLSRFGWHIIWLQEERMIQPYDEMRKDLKVRCKRDERYREVEEAYANKLRAEYNLPASMPVHEVLAVEEANLENKHPELAALMKEYHDGILLFDVSLKEVWDKASLDTVGITNFFNQHKKEYTWTEPRYKGRVVYCKTAASMKAAKQILKTAHPDSIDSYINHRLNQDSTVYVRTERGLWKKGQNAAVDKLQWKSGDWAPAEEYPYVFLAGKVLKRPEEYTDERGKVTSAYQDYLEQEWVAELRQKYTVEVNQEALEELKAL